MKTKTKVNILESRLEKQYFLEPFTGNETVPIQELIMDKINPKTGNVSLYPIILSIILN